jgi:hypothetical protein
MEGFEPSHMGLWDPAATTGASPLYRANIPFYRNINSLKLVNDEISIFSFKLL